MIVPVADTDYEEDYPDPPVARRVCTSAACIQAANGIIQNMDPRYITLSRQNYFFTDFLVKKWLCLDQPSTFETLISAVPFTDNLLPFATIHFTVDLSNVEKVDGKIYCW